MVYNKIISGERIAAYKFYEDYWYVVVWNKQTFIHYRQTVRAGKAIFHWFLCDSILSPKWNCQTQQIEV